MEIKDYKINVRVKGYDLTMNVIVPAKNPDEAFDLACGHEFRYQDEDPYCLVVMAGEEPSVLCTYETLEEATVHCENITSGEWALVQKTEGGNFIIRSSEQEKDGDEDLY